MNQVFFISISCIILPVKVTNNVIKKYVALVCEHLKYSEHMIHGKVCSCTT